MAHYDRFDIIWTDPHPYDNITNTSSENCPGLDGGGSQSRRWVFRLW
jgi:hypothetical protein